MSVMIWDSTSQAFKEATSIKRYDQQNDAWTDCTSAQVQENGVWVEKLQKPRTYLYKDGDECTNITGGWKYQPYNYYSSSFTSKTPIIERRPDSLYTKLTSITSFNCSLIGTAKVIDISKYSKMCCEVSGKCSRKGAQWGNIVAFTDGYRNNYNYHNTPSIQVCYGGYNGSSSESNHTLYECDISRFSESVFAIEHICDSSYAPDFVQLFKLWLE